MPSSVAVHGSRAQPDNRGATLVIMTVLVWVTGESWMACVDAALVRAPTDEVTLLHVTDAGAADAAQGAFSALLGRGGAGPGGQLEAMVEAAATEVLEAAAARLARPAQQLRRRGRPEREVVQVAGDATLLILARQGGEAGPRSLGKAARFVVDHAPCPVLLVWPGPAPAHPLPPPPDGPPPGRLSGPRRHRGGPGEPGQRLE
jgi:nucleotide-binding universal stress UspA family protein